MAPSEEPGLVRCRVWCEWERACVPSIICLTNVSTTSVTHRQNSSVICGVLQFYHFSCFVIVFIGASDKKQKVQSFTSCFRGQMWQISLTFWCTGKLFCRSKMLLDGFSAIKTGKTVNIPAWFWINKYSKLIKLPNLFCSSAYTIV